MTNAERRQKCPQGHSMDPNWENCPYCEAQKRAKQKTSEAVVVDSSSSRKGTVVGKVPPRAGKRETKTMEPQASFGPGGHVGEGETRRIVGVLISYTWRPEGDLYPVREGRNYIGRGKISSDAYHRNCDVMIPEDDRMSGTHALILCRHGNYEIIDQEASNGTFLNGEMLMANTSTKLTNYAEIKTGHTLWTFIKIEVSRTAQPDTPPKKSETPPSSEKKSDRETIVR
jgi:hypothetical protein